MVSALAMGLILGALFSLMGMFVVTKGMAFFSDFVAHSALLGVALAALLELEPSTFLIFYSLAVAFVASAVWSRFPLSRDTVLGVLYGGSVSTGIIIIYVKGLRQSSILQFLFGDILLISNTDIWFAALLLAVFTIFFVTNRRKLIKATFIPEIAMSEGINVKLYGYSLIALMAITIALSIKTVGVILANAMVVMPAASAKVLSRSFRQFTFISLIIGVASFGSGIILSHYMDIPSGPAVAAVSFVVFIVSLALGGRKGAV